MKTIILTESQASLLKAVIDFARRSAEVASYEEVGVADGTDEEVEAGLKALEAQL